jgi:hypothetical protein
LWFVKNPKLKENTAAAMTSQTSETNNSPAVLLYLPKSDWSPRYDSTFYSFMMEGKSLINLQQPPTPSSIGGRKELPAYYYTVTVFREHSKTPLLRRYSQFSWLSQQLMSNPPVTDPHRQVGTTTSRIRLPPGTCLWVQGQDDEFAQNRMEQLGEFLDEVLRRPGYANHPAVLAFLELR